MVTHKEGEIKVEKAIIVTMPDSSQWQIPCKVIAEDRAVYYAEDTDKNKRPYDEVYEETMSNMDLLLDWGENNIKWSFLKQYAKMIKTPNVDYEDGWCNGDKRIVDI